MTNNQAGKLLELADAVLAAKAADNALDCMVEVALFKPDSIDIAARLNAAGTKVIYTHHDGSELTVWSLDWTHDEATRAQTAAALRALAQERQS